MAKIIIEQTNDYLQRMKYDPETNTFHETGRGSLSYVRGVTFPYGWLKESGTPPDEHLDVILVTRERLKLGDELLIRVIGVFKRRDNSSAPHCQDTILKFTRIPPFFRLQLSACAWL